jgi:hypothetical protein
MRPGSPIILLSEEGLDSWAIIPFPHPRNRGLLQRSVQLDSREKFARRGPEATIAARLDRLDDEHLEFVFAVVGRARRQSTAPAWAATAGSSSKPSLGCITSSVGSSATNAPPTGTVRTPPGSIGVFIGTARLDLGAGTLLCRSVVMARHENVRG